LKEIFSNQLIALGLAKGDTVMVHSSMKALGTEMTPQDFIKLILNVIGEEGTLLMPALSYENVTAQNPEFNIKITEPCIGLLPRTFFKVEGVLRSFHPTHSVCAYGKNAEEITSRHYLDETPVGPNSPFTLLADYGGKVLFIGDTVNCCTLMHGIEEIAGAPYVLQKERTHYVMIGKDGKKTETDLFAHDFTGWDQEYQKIKDILEYPELKKGKVGKADCYLIDAKALVKKALEILKEDIYYFVSKSE